MPELSTRLAAALESDAIIVAATPRLAQEIQRNNALQHPARAKTAWRTGNLRSWDNWLREIGEQVLWSGYSSPSGRRRLLTSLQQRLLWERIVSQSVSPRPPININGTASLAAEAWELIQQYRLPDPGTVGFISADQDAFSGWMKHYHSECLDNAWLDTARVIDSLVPAINSGAVPVPEQVVLVGFDSFNPQQRGLLRALTNMGSRLSLLRPERINRRASLVTVPDADAELQMGVRWLRGLLATKGTTRAGLVVPDLDHAFVEVERAIDDALLPGGNLPGADSDLARPYDIGAGRPLRKQPVVVAADHILALSMGTVSMRVFSRIVRSPFLSGGIAEGARRARFDAWMREKGSVDIDVQHMTGMLEAFRHHTGLSSDEFIFERAIKAMLAREDDGQSRSPAVWADHFRELLGLFGWPGDGRQDAIQRQAARDFDQLLREFATLDIIMGNMAPAEALRILRQLLRQRLFEYDATNVPILVLNPVEAEWLSFDHLWICGASRSDWLWPGRVPNPFIPTDWLQQCQIADSCPELRATRKHVLAERLIGGAAELIVTQTQDAYSVQPAPAFAALPVVAVDDLEIADLTDYRQALLASTNIETLADEAGPALEPVESLNLDQDVLALQAACPFKAFATSRLGASTFKALRPGLLPEARVVLVRMALEHFWNRLGTSEILQAALSGEHLEVQIWEVADTVLAVFERKLPVRLSSRYRALEHARLVRLLMQWLKVEIHRAPFEVVQTDAHAKLELAGVSLRAHVDRIDMVGDKGLAVIDYDTVEFDPQRWLAPRPDSPALILYALASETQPVAMLTGCVAVERMNLSGVQHVPGIVVDVPVFEDSSLARLAGTDWDTLRDRWKAALSELTGEFAAGDARVLPKYGATTCKTCTLSSLCRVAEQVAS